MAKKTMKTDINGHGRS